MESAYPLVPLEDVIARSEEWTSILPDTRYKEITVRMWGRGVILRGELDGTEIASSRRLVAREDQLILSRIDARNGAIGIVPHYLDGAVVSNDFPTFGLREDRILPGYLNWLAKTNAFVDLCRAASEGTTNRVRLQENRFLRLQIPLPDISEQRRMVTRIEALAGKIEEAKGLKAKGLQETRALLVALARREDVTDEQREALGWRKAKLGTVIRQVQDLVSVHAEDAYPNLGIYSFGRGLFPKPPIPGISSSATVLNRVRSGQFIYSRLFAFEGSYGYVSEAYDGRYVSGEYPTFDCDPEQVRAEFLYAYFMSPDVWATVAQGSKGLGDRRQRVQPAQVLSHELWLPPIEHQNQVAALMQKTTTLTEHQVESTNELDALLPAVLDRAFRELL